MNLGWKIDSVFGGGGITKIPAGMPKKSVTPDTYEIIKHYEGIHDGDLSRVGLQPKLCPAGVWTIGYGHALIDPLTHKQLKEGQKDRAYELADTITEEEALTYLHNDVTEYARYVRDCLKMDATPYQFGAMVSFTYNLGIGNFTNSTLLRMFNKGDIDGSAQQFTLWIYANGKIMPGLEHRRKTEALYFRTGVLKFFN